MKRRNLADSARAPNPVLYEPKSMREFYLAENGRCDARDKDWTGRGSIASFTNTGWNPVETIDDSDRKHGAIVRAKEARRHRLARASFAQKIAALVSLQAMAAPSQRRRGRQVAPWRVAT